MTAAYPLLWPEGRPRRAPAQRKPGKFHRTERVYSSGGSYNRKLDMTIAAAIARLQDELDRIHARYVVVSANVELRLDGLPRSGAREPDDPAIAVYFQLDGRPHCLPCDTYTTVAANIAAVAAHIEATRAIERHGVASVAEMFSGFAALPAPSDVRQWRTSLGFRAEARPSRAEIEARWRELAAKHHPDRGGSQQQMAEINAARDAALKEIA